MAFDAIQAIGACYDAPGDDAAWMERVARALEPLGRGLGVAAGLVELRAGPPALVASARSGGPPPGGRDDAARALAELPRDLVARWLSGPAGVEHLGRRAGLPNTLVLFAGAGPARLVAVSVALAPARRPSPRLARTCRQLAAHLGAAACAHEVGPEHRGERLLRAEPGEAGILWSGLWDGRWAAVGRRAGAGAHGLLLRRCDPLHGDPRALTARERDVLALVAEGRSNKEVGWLLGIAPATAATHLGAALRKLGVRSRAELIALLASPGDDAEGEAPPDLSPPSRAAR